MPVDSVQTPTTEQSIEQLGGDRNNPVAIQDARAFLGELVNRAAYGGQRVVISRNGRPIAALISIPDLDKLSDHAG